MHSGWQDAAWKYAHSKARRWLADTHSGDGGLPGSRLCIRVCRRPAGLVSMFRVGAGAVSKPGGGHIGPNAHVVAVNAETHNFCFPLKNFGGHLSYRLVDAALVLTALGE